MCDERSVIVGFENFMKSQALGQMHGTIFLAVVSPRIFITSSLEDRYILALVMV